MRVTYRVFTGGTSGMVRLQPHPAGISYPLNRGGDQAQTGFAPTAEHLVSEADHAQFSRLVTEDALRVDNGQADTSARIVWIVGGCPDFTDLTLDGCFSVGVRQRSGRRLRRRRALRALGFVWGSA